MFDDIANSEDNPIPGKIFNRPNGPDVYAGVPKDYTGTDEEYRFKPIHPKKIYLYVLFSISEQGER